jgi:hypothetical protein
MDHQKLWIRLRRINVPCASAAVGHHESENASAEVDLIEPLNKEDTVVAAGYPPSLASTSGPFSTSAPSPSPVGFGCHARGRGKLRRLGFQEREEEEGSEEGTGVEARSDPAPLSMPREDFSHAHRALYPATKSRSPRPSSPQSPDQNER